MRINHLFISSTDVERSTRFYCGLLGFVPTNRFNEGFGECQVVHRDVQGRDLELLIVPTGTAKLAYAHHVAFEADSAAEFESIFETAKTMDLAPRAGVPLESGAGVSTFSMNGKTYRHFYVLDPSWVNVEIMWCVQSSTNPA
jgi:catechol 2,3-dioxygenase-like lactoylglutathione lyase family enzyme